MIGEFYGSFDVEAAVHVADQIGEHFIGGDTLALQVGKHVLLAFRCDDIRDDLPLLAEPPTSPDALIIALEAMGWKGDRVSAMLKVEAPSADLFLSDKSSLLAFDEVEKLGLLVVVLVLAANLHGIRYQALEQVALVVKRTPYDEWLSGFVDQFGRPFASLHPAARAGLVEIARRLDPLILRWAH